MSYRMSVDIGGTFTDLVVVDEEGRIRVFKSSTTPEDYVAAVIEHLRQASDSFGIPLEGLMQECSSFIGGSLVHGSTIATNALIEKKLAKTGLICTRGFRDILTDREGGKAEPFNWDQDYPPAYLPRYLTLPVTERINAEGEIETPLLEEEVRQAVRQFQEWGVEVIAVSLIWSIVNPVHELRVGEICREEAPRIPCVLSHQVNPIIREYRRTSSTAINASLLPIVGQYVENFEKRLKEIGFPGGMLMLTSTGGVMSTEELVEKPIYSIDCGPSLAPTAGLWLGQRELGKADVITADMGGTSFDISCVSDGVIAVSRDVWVGDSILGVSKVDIKSIGAGGGSIAWVDSGGLLHVGPESAGAVPGPACYGRGGSRPTVTDANLVLGYIDPDFFLGGAMALRPELAEAAIRKEVAKPLGLRLEQAAFSIWSAVNVDMVSAIEDITVWQGIDPREYLFVSGGGAAGLHVIPMIQEIGASDILIPKAAGVISALGGVFADITADFSSSRFTESDRFDFAAVEGDMAELEARALAFLEGAGYRRSKGGWSSPSRPGTGARSGSSRFRSGEAGSRTMKTSHCWSRISTRSTRGPSASRSRGVPSSASTGGPRPSDCSRSRASRRFPPVAGIPRQRCAARERRTSASSGEWWIPPSSWATRSRPETPSRPPLSSRRRPPPWSSSPDPKCA